MSSWIALNVEPEEDNVSEVDDTKEIQLEEAFKLYQNALKLHSQGPTFYQEAEDAYEQLFQSDVFKYPEAVSEFDHDQLEESLPMSAIPVDISIVPVVTTGPVESANSLPQLIYLAYKARAQFLVDQCHALENQYSPRDWASTRRHYAKACSKSLSDSAAALERDDTDLDLWKRSARVSDALLTSRAVRFCFESVLAGDDEGEDAIDLSGLDEAFAKTELQTVLRLVEDDLTDYRTPKVQPRRFLKSLLKHSNDPYPFLPRLKELGYIEDSKRPLAMANKEIRLTCSAVTYEGVTTALAETIARYNNGEYNDIICTELCVELPMPDLLANSQSDTKMLDAEHHHAGVLPTTLATAFQTETDADSPASFHSVGSELIRVSEPPQESVTQQVSGIVEEAVQFEKDTPNESAALLDSVPLPSRKRSSTAAGNEEPEARSKSKRIKARESLAGPSVADDEAQQDPSFLYRDQFVSIEAADDLAFNVVNSILERVRVTTLGSVDALRQLQDEPEETSSEELVTSDAACFRPFRDLRRALKHWDERKYNAFTTGNGGRDHMEGSTGLSLFLKHSKAPLRKETASLMNDSHRIRQFANTVKERGSGVHETVYLWLVHLLTSCRTTGTPAPYLQGLWSLDLKEGVTMILTTCNEDLTKCFLANPRIAKAIGISVSQALSPVMSEGEAAEFAQTMFEMHLDIYSEMNNPASTIDQHVRTKQLARVRSWAQISADIMQNMQFEDDTAAENSDPIVLRFLWTSVMFAKVSGEANKDHILLCLHDLQKMLEASASQEIVLPNTTTMSSISALALEQEISKVETLEFFMSVFDSDNSDPYSVIMKLEPILEYTGQSGTDSPALSASEREQIENFRSFLDAGDASLTLFLWKRLQNAYTALSYNTKVVSCLLRSIETIVRELFTTRNADTETTERQLLLLRWIRDADEILAKVMGKILDDRFAFECVDEAHLQSSMSAIIELLRLVHTFVLMDDGLRVGSATPPQHKNATAHKHFEKCRDRFREMYVRLWTLLYVMIKEAIVQMPNVFDSADDDLILFLRTVHASLGERQYCKQCNKLFVRISKGELFSLKSDQDLSLDVAQVIYDLYQIKLSTGQGDLDHGCSAEPLEKDKRTAHDLVPIIMDYVTRLNIKDLLKSELKATIDRIQSALGQAKPSTALTFNRKAVSAYLKSLINPQRLFQSLRGIGELEHKMVSGDFEKIASQGWYLLLGGMTLAKYRSVKRINPTPTDDLDNALSFLRQDLEHSPMKNWESWYRIAQVYDAKIEDCLMWNSNKLNEGRADLSTLERNAINAYAMATALAMRATDESEVSPKMLNDMFFEFAVRLYSSSRPPLNMEAFNTERSVRHLSNYISQVMSIEPLVSPMPEYMVWTFAAHLIRRSLSGDSKPWIRFYMLGKCLWKMFMSTNRPKAQRAVEVDEVIDAFSEAVERVPKKEKSADPILEPHFKLVSIVHKLQDARIVSPKAAVEHMQATSYANAVQLRDDENGKPDWEAYILAIIEKLQKADKSGWHHRITARAAHVIWDNERSVGAALGAKHKFADSIFTKNMTMQVWKPENERPGRHYVYTGRYLQFFIEILNVLRDRSNLEQVVRKIRRKTTDFINHTKVWEDAVTVYIDLLRSIGNVPRGRERALFDSITFDEFTRQSEKLEKWAHEPDTTSRYLDLLQDAIEMKKLNNSLSKSSVIDDLIGDAYACMYEEFVAELPPEEQAQPTNTSLPQGTFINMNTETVPTGDDNRDRMRLNNLLSSQTDGAGGSELVAKPTGLGIMTNISQSTETPPPEAVRVPAPSKPGRAKTITKREVQKKAEALISKPPPIKTPTLSKKPLLVNIPSLRKSESQEQKDKDDGSVRGKANVASNATSQRGSLSRRNSIDTEGADGDDDGGDDGDNEEEEEDEDEDINEASDSDAGGDKMPRKRLFPGLVSTNIKHEDGHEDEEEEEEGNDNQEDEDAGDYDEDKMSDVQGQQGKEHEMLEIPDSQEAIEVEDNKSRKFSS